MCINLGSLSNSLGIKLASGKLLTGKSLTDKPLKGKPLKVKRKKIWELEHRLHCSVAGTCFTLDEMRRFCRKCQIGIDGSLSDYEMHINFVDILSDAQASRPAAKYLDRKYKVTIQHFDQAESSDQLKLLWDKAVFQGEVAAAFWSLLTHPLASETLLFQVYGEVHMLSHLSGAAIRLDMQELAQLRQRAPGLERKVADSHAELLHRTRKKDKVIEILNKRLAQALQSEKLLQQAENRVESLESGEMQRHLRTQLGSIAEKLKKERLRVVRAESEAAELKVLASAQTARSAQSEQQLLVLNAEHNALENALESALFKKHLPCEQSGHCKQINKIDLAGRQILYVGGRNRLCAHFRTLVEQQNGRFIHHDGGREESPQRLDALLSQVDAVLCPMDCVSHDAVYRIKRDCKRYGKHLALLPHSSLSAFTKGIYEFSRVAMAAH